MVIPPFEHHHANASDIPLHGQREINDGRHDMAELPTFPLPISTRLPNQICQERALYKFTTK
eukprot:8383609-Ditylum_brightwellii.AAC.1